MNKYETAVYINLQNNRCGVWKEKTEIRVKTEYRQHTDHTTEANYLMKQIHLKLTVTEIHISDRIKMKVYYLFTYTLIKTLIWIWTTPFNNNSTVVTRNPPYYNSPRFKK